jgi:hypothetical protein
MLDVVFAILAEPSPMRTDLPAPGSVSAGTVGGVFFTFMVLASYLLYRNLNFRLRRLDEQRRTADTTEE